MNIKKNFLESSSFVRKSFPKNIINKTTTKKSKKIKYKKDLFFFGRMIFTISLLKRKLIIILVTKSITIIKG